MGLRRLHVDTDNMEDGAITTAKLATGAVTTQKIAAGAVTQAKRTAIRLGDPLDVLTDDPLFDFNTERTPNANKDTLVTVSARINCDGTADHGDVTVFVGQASPLVGTDDRAQLANDFNDADNVNAQLSNILLDATFVVPAAWIYEIRSTIVQGDPAFTLHIVTEWTLDP